MAIQESKRSFIEKVCYIINLLVYWWWMQRNGAQN